MPRPRYPHTQREVTRHGRTVWYFRRGKGPRIRLPGAYGSPEFKAAYESALTGTKIDPTPEAPRKTLRWLVDRYYESKRFTGYAKNTKNNIRSMLETVCETGGKMNYAAIDAKDIRRGMERRSGAMVNVYLATMRGLLRFALDNEWIDADPTSGLRADVRKSDGFHTWTVEEVETFRHRWPVGTQERLAMDLLLYTGLRRVDAVRLGPAHISDGTITVRTQKTRAEVTLPLRPELVATINATVTGETFLLSPKGKAWSVGVFGIWFRKACEEAGVPGRAHGLRKAGATIAANNGATPFELAALFGWSGTKMAEVYTKKADRKRLAAQAMQKAFPHSKNECGND